MTDAAMTRQNANTVGDHRGTCASCPASAEGCAARQAFAIDVLLAP